MANIPKDAEYALVDYARIIGAVAIVYFHLKLPYGHLALFALPMFATYAFYFLACQFPQMATDSAARSRTKRLLFPWLFWSAIYLVAKLLDATISDRPFAEELSIWMLLTGPAIHLWFLPYLLISNLTFLLLAPNFYRIRNGYLTIYVAYFGICIAASYISKQDLLNTPFVQWLYVLPASIFGIIVAMRPLCFSNIVVLAILSGLIYLVQYVTSLTDGAIQLLTSSTVVLFTLSFYKRRTQTSVSLGQASLGIYLVHPLVYAILLRIGEIKVNQWIVFVSVVLISFFTAFFANRIRLTKSIV